MDISCAASVPTATPPATTVLRCSKPCKFHHVRCPVAKHCSSSCHEDTSTQSQGFLDSVCWGKALTVAVYRLHMLYPLLNRFGVSDAAIQHFFLDISNLEYFWCITDLFDWIDSRTSIEETISLLSPQDLFRPFRWPLADTRVRALLSDEQAAYLSQALLGDDQTAEAEIIPCQCWAVYPWIPHLDPKERYYWKRYRHLAEFLIVHQCGSVGCPDCDTAKKAVLNHPSFVDTPKSVSVVNGCPMLCWDMSLPKLCTFQCHTSYLVNLGIDLTPFVQDYESFFNLLITMPSMIDLRNGDVSNKIVTITGVLHCIDVTTLPKILALAQESGDCTPLNIFFKKCRSPLCNPLLEFVHTLVEACSREDLIVWYKKNNFPESMCLVDSLFLKDNDYVGNRLTTQAGQDQVLEQVVPILCHILTPADLLATMWRTFSLFRQVCARGSLKSVTLVYQYVKAEMETIGISLAKAHTYDEPYKPLKDFILAAVRKNSSQVCSFLLYSAREESPQLTSLMIPRWAAEATRLGRKGIYDVITSPMMVKSAVY